MQACRSAHCTKLRAVWSIQSSSVLVVSLPTLARRRSLCELLKAFPGWEAIKTTRGHYRSCGKDPKACCVSHLLSEEPLVRSGRDETYKMEGHRTLLGRRRRQRSLVNLY